MDFFHVVFKGIRGDSDTLVVEIYDQLIVLNGGSPSAEPLQNGVQ